MLKPCSLILRAVARVASPSLTADSCLTGACNDLSLVAKSWLVGRVGHVRGDAERLHYSHLAAEQGKDGPRNVN